MIAKLISVRLTFSQVSKMVEGCRKRKTHSPVRLALGEKKNRTSKTNSGSNTATNTPSTSEANGQQTPNMGNQRSTFDYRWGGAAERESVYIVCVCVRAHLCVCVCA